MNNKKVFYSDVSIYQDDNMDYPEKPPFDPSTMHPEYVIGTVSSSGNRVYEGFRQTLFLLGMDKENYGKASWNPFKELIAPGQKVVIKPNFVVSSHEEGGDIFSIITHPSILRAAVDYCYIALKGNGKIIICDAPDMNCNFTELVEKTRIDSIAVLYKDKLDFEIEVFDLRNFWLHRKNTYKGSGSSDRINLPGDPLGGVLINLGKDSLLYGVDKNNKFYGADFNRDETIKHHCGETQEYLISKTILSADTFISVPKLKVHKKVGVTLNIKGLVGANVNKNYLVHFKIGSPSEGGDQYPAEYFEKTEIARIKVQRWAFDRLLSKKNSIGDFFYEVIRKTGKLFYKIFGFNKNKEKSVVDGGNWYGNDSAWRMAVDLYKIFIYFDKDGKMHDHPVRKMFSIVDGIIGGENSGPLTPDSKKCGAMVAGYDFFLVDFICARMMGFDYRKIRKLKYISEHPAIYLTAIDKLKIFSNNKKYQNFLGIGPKDKLLNFKPHIGWQGNIEIL